MILGPAKCNGPRYAARLRDAGFEPLICFVHDNLAVLLRGLAPIRLDTDSSQSDPIPRDAPHKTNSRPMIVNRQAVFVIIARNYCATSPRWRHDLRHQNPRSETTDPASSLVVQ